MELAVITLQLYLGLAECFTVELPNVVLLLVEVLFIYIGHQIFLADDTFLRILIDHLAHEVTNG